MAAPDKLPKISPTVAKVVDRILVPLDVAMTEVTFRKSGLHKEQMPPPPSLLSKNVPVVKFADRGPRTSTEEGSHEIISRSDELSRL